MTEDEIIQARARIALKDKLTLFGYNPLPESVPADRISFLSGNGDRREIVLCSLNLDEARSVSINQRDFNYTPRPDLLILLTVYMSNTNPVMYLIPSMVFTTPGNIFLNNEQPVALRHFSTWEIKVFTRAIEELSHYALDAVNEL